MANEITTAQMARVLSIEFVERLTESLSGLFRVLGILDVETYAAGTALKRYKITGTLQDGDIEELAEVPYSQYKEEEVAVEELKLEKFRKGTTEEAVLKSGYEAAVANTDAKFLNDIRKTIRTKFYDFLATGTGTAAGADLKEAIANTAGKLAAAESEFGYEGTPIFFANPEDVYAYLGKAQVYNVETAFGWKYVENFLGIGTTFLDAKVPSGTVYGTFMENIHAYAVDIAAINEMGFEYVTDETGIVGIAHSVHYENGVADTNVRTGLLLMPEYINLIIKGTVAATVDPNAPASGDGNGEGNEGGN